MSAVVNRSRAQRPEEIGRRIDACTAELMDAAWQWLATERHFDGTIANDIKRIANGDKSRETMMKELFVLNRLGEILREVGDVTCEQTRAGLASMTTSERLRPAKLSDNHTREGDLRQRILRGLFNAICYRDAQGVRHGANLGRLWFASSEDDIVPGSEHELAAREADPKKIPKIEKRSRR